MVTRKQSPEVADLKDRLRGELALTAHLVESLVVQRDDYAEQLRKALAGRERYGAEREAKGYDRGFREGKAHRLKVTPPTTAPTSVASSVVSVGPPAAFKELTRDDFDNNDDWMAWEAYGRELAMKAAGVWTDDDD